MCENPLAHSLFLSVCTAIVKVIRWCFCRFCCQHRRRRRPVYTSNIVSRILWDLKANALLLLHIIEWFWWHIGWYNHLSPFECVRTSHIHIYILDIVEVSVVVVNTILTVWRMMGLARVLCARLFLVRLANRMMVWGACSSPTQLNLFQTHQTKNVCMPSD